MNRSILNKQPRVKNPRFSRSLNKLQLTTTISKIVFFSTFISFTSFVIVILDKNSTYRYYAFVLSVVPVAIIAVVWTKNLKLKLNFLKNVGILYLFIILLLALVTRFILLTDYPFVSLSDELRDGGLNSLEISSGAVKDIFGYGRYGAHGLIIPTLTSFFYKFLGSTVLVYRLPAALISIVNIVLIFLLLSQVTKNKIASFLGTYVLVSLPLHLYYSRTEVVVILSSLFSTAILISLFVMTRRKLKNVFDYIFLGTLLGFSFNFHASVKAFSMIVLLTVVALNIFYFLLKKVSLSEAVILLSTLTFFVIIGFGPRIIKTTPSTFFHTSRVSIASKEYMNTESSVFVDTAEKYKDSLLVWIVKPTNAWYPDHKPILHPILFILMILGIVVGIAKKNIFLISVLTISLIVHLTNSALTDIVNGDHRLSPLYPIGALFIGVGINYLLNIKKNRFLNSLCIFSFTLFFSYQILSFFINQPANKNKVLGDYLSMHTMHFVQNDKNLKQQNHINLIVSPVNYKMFNYLHYQEQHKYFLPMTRIETTNGGDYVSDNEVYINNKNANFRKIVTCTNNKYRCPPGYKGNIIIHY